MKFLNLVIFIFFWGNGGILLGQNLNSIDILPPKHSDKSIHLKDLKLRLLAKKNKFLSSGRNDEDLNRYSGEVKIGIDRFEFTLFEIADNKRSIEQGVYWSRGKFEFLKQPSEEDEYIYKCTHAGSTVEIRFLYVFNRLLNYSIDVTNDDFIYSLGN